MSDSNNNLQLLADTALHGIQMDKSNKMGSSFQSLNIGANAAIKHKPASQMPSIFGNVANTTTTTTAANTTTTTTAANTLVAANTTTTTTTAANTSAFGKIVHDKSMIITKPYSTNNGRPRFIAPKPIPFSIAGEFLPSNAPQPAMSAPRLLMPAPQPAMSATRPAMSATRPAMPTPQPAMSVIRPSQSILQSNAVRKHNPIKLPKGHYVKTEQCLNHLKDDKTIHAYNMEMHKYTEDFNNKLKNSQYFINLEKQLKVENDAYLAALKEDNKNGNKNNPRTEFMRMTVARIKSLMDAQYRVAFESYIPKPMSIFCDCDHKQ